MIKKKTTKMWDKSTRLILTKISKGTPLKRALNKSKGYRKIYFLEPGKTDQYQGPLNNVRRIS